MEQTTERFLLLEKIVTEALGVPEEARETLVAARCGEDLPLAAEVRLLIDACNAEEDLMASCRLEPRAVPDEKPQRTIVGPYEIDRLLGRGGMGAVYLAHRADGHFEQKVAIKLIDRPFETDLFRERFRQERQILAGLQHPYIARLLDGGVTADGELYLVMEYVDGVPIHRFCLDRQLSQTQRIELFLRACEAVQFAHQNFVVHRDLKPDNILVAADGTPRLLDFGTAKLLSPSLENQDSQLTREGYLSFTPQYASPEQVLGNAITTASDTYSLGVLLYLLLTGAPPYELKQATTGEMLRTVCEEAPPRPSPLAGAGNRFDGDLEAILLKALRKEPQERYLTAERLADDLRAYLEGRPVAARRGTLRYVGGKFIRRHRLALAAAALLVITLISGIVGVGWQARVANRERRIADEERRKADARSDDLRKLSNSLLSELDDAIQQLPGSTGVQKLLVTRVLEHLDRMGKDAHGDRQTELDLANAYTRLADLQGNSFSQNLGDAAGALASIDKAIALSQPWAGPGSRDREAIHVLGNAQLSRSELLFTTAPIEQAVAATRETIRTYERIIAMGDLTSDERVDVANGYSVLGDELGLISDQSLNDLPGALAAYQKFLDLNRQALRIDPNDMDAKRDLAFCQEKIIDIEMETDPARALADAQADLEHIAALPKNHRESLPMQRVQTALLLDKILALVQLGQYSQANTLIDNMLKPLRSQVAADPQDQRALSDLNVGLIQASAEYQMEADPELSPSPAERRQSLARAERSLTEEINVIGKLTKNGGGGAQWQPYLADASINLGSIQFILKHGDHPTEMVKKGLVVMRNLASQAQSPSTILDDAAQDFLSPEPASLKDPKLAVACAERAVALSHRKLPSRLLTLAQAYRATGQTAKSQAVAEEALALLPPPQDGAVMPRIRKLLELLAAAHP